MKLREFNKSDLVPIEILHQKQPEYIPSLDRVIDNKTIVDDLGNVRGYAVVKVFAEGVLFLDRDLGVKDKAQVVKLVMNQALKSCKENHLDVLYIFVDDSVFPGYSRVLEKRYKAKHVPGSTLFIDLSNNEY